MLTIGMISEIEERSDGREVKPLWFMRLRVSFFMVLALVGLTVSRPARAGNQVVAWGAGTVVKTSDGVDYGQSIVPAGLTNAVQVAAGRWHSLALRADGTLQGWGRNDSLQLDFSITNQYVAVACGSIFSLGLQSNGTVVVSEGDDGYGEAEVPTGLSNVVAIAGGFVHSVALKADGTVVAWGADADVSTVGTFPNYGQTIVPAGVSNVVAIAAGGYHTMALAGNGTVWEWGDETTSEIPAGLSNVVAIATGAEHNVALLANGTVTAWGDDTYGETNVPVGLSNVVAIAAGSWHTLALEKNGTVVAWGAGVGSYTNVDFKQTVVPSGLSNVVQVAGGWYHSLALKGSARPVLRAALTAGGFNTNGFNVSVPSANGRVYQLEYTSSLLDPVWTALPLEPGNGGLLELNDAHPIPAGQRFYQVNRW